MVGIQVLFAHRQHAPAEAGALLVDDEIDLTPGEGDEDDHDVAEVGLFDLALRKTTDATTVSVGDVVPFDITVFNQGSVAATDITVDDLLPAGTEFVQLANPGWAFADGTASTTIGGPLEPGDQVKVTIFLLVTGSQDEMVNTAEIGEAHGPDGTPVTDIDSTPDDDLTNDQNWKNIYFTLGKWAYNADGTALGYTDDKPLVDFLSLAQRLVKSGAAPERAEEIAQFRDKSVEQKPGAIGKAAMDYFNSNQLVAYWKAAGDNRNFKLLPIPRAEGGKSANYIKPSQFFSVTSQSKHPAEAAMFIDFITNDIDANKILQGERGVPIAAKVRAALKPTLTKAQAETFDFVDRVGKTAQPIPPPDPKGHADIVKNVWTPQVADPVMFGKITPQAGAELLRKEATTILSANK